MNVKSLLSGEQLIAGIEVSETSIKLALLQKDKKTKQTTVICLAQENLTEGIVASGLIIKQQEFIEALRKLKAQAPKAFQYAVLSIAPFQTYVKVFSFPNA